MTMTDRPYLPDEHEQLLQFYVRHVIEATHDGAWGTTNSLRDQVLAEMRRGTEAIRQRDEAVRLLREQTMTVGWALDYSEDEFGDKPPLHEFDPGAFAQARAHDEQARAFLANFKEDSTND